MPEDPKGPEWVINPSLAEMPVHRGDTALMFNRVALVTSLLGTAVSQMLAGEEADARQTISEALEAQTQLGEAIDRVWDVWERDDGGR